MPKSRVISGLLVSALFMIVLLGCASTSTSSSTGEYLDDSVITTKVKALLVKDTALKAFQISVETYKGRGATERLCRFSQNPGQG